MLNLCSINKTTIYKTTIYKAKYWRSGRNFFGVTDPEPPSLKELFDEETFDVDNWEPSGLNARREIHDLFRQGIRRAAYKGAVCLRDIQNTDFSDDSPDFKELPFGPLEEQLPRDYFRYPPTVEEFQFQADSLDDAEEKRRPKPLPFKPDPNWEPSWLALFNKTDFEEDDILQRFTKR